MLPNESHDALTKVIAMPSVARLAALLRDKAFRTNGSQSLEQPENLASLQAQQNRRILDPKFAALNAHQRIKP